MNRIRVLSDQVANQIAAGEVVERPASVVKELVENAIDADAKKISIDIQAGGRGLIRVSDDGYGMSREDALLSLERHGTSKLRAAEDLASIDTMGFRGEAVPSIASVSRFTLTTRERDSGEPEGTEILVEGGKVIEVRSAGRAPGTTIETRQLFFNLPARKKFLKTEETERGHIQHCLALAALAHPHVAFEFRSDKRMIWRLPAAPAVGDSAARMSALSERLRALYGAEMELIPVEREEPFPVGRAIRDGGSGSEGMMRIWGFTGAPGVCRANRQDQHVFVNRRPIEHRGLNQALLEGYRGAMPKGRYPICCLFLEMPTASVDVNIHPAKREVKFERDREVRLMVADAVRDALLAIHRDETTQPEPHADRDAGPQPPEPLKARPFPNSEPRAANLELPETPTGPAPTTANSTTGQLKASPPSNDSCPETDKRAPKTIADEAGIGPTASAEAMAAARKIAAMEAEIRNAPVDPAPLLKVPLRLLGVVARNYIVLESDRGLVLMDRRAAHERVLFERMLETADKESAPSQRLLLPETVELSARDAAFVREHLDALSRLGIGLGEFGEHTFLLDSLPPFARGVEARRFVIELIDDLKAAGASAGASRLTEQMIAKSICHRAVNASDLLDDEELENLVEDLRRCTMPYTCPTGRPTLIEMNERELARKFGRGF